MVEGFDGTNFVIHFVIKVVLSIADYHGAQVNVKDTSVVQEEQSREKCYSVYKKIHEKLSTSVAISINETH